MAEWALLPSTGRVLNKSVSTACSRVTTLVPDPHSVETTMLCPGSLMTFTHCLLPFLSTYQQLIASNVEETSLYLDCSFTYPGGETQAFMSHIPTVGCGTFQTLQTIQDGTFSAKLHQHGCETVLVNPNFLNWYKLQPAMD